MIAASVAMTLSLAMADPCKSRGATIPRAGVTIIFPVPRYCTKRLRASNPTVLGMGAEDRRFGSGSAVPRPTAKRAKSTDKKAGKPAKKRKAKRVKRKRRT